MNQDQFAGWWKQMKGQARQWWGDITDDEIDQVQGQSEKLAGLLQRKYGYSRERAEEEIERRMRSAA